MIGRFPNQGTYRELIRSRDVLRVMAAGFLALAGYACGWAGVGGPALGTLLVLASVALNGVPIVVGAFSGLLERRVNVDELVSLAIIASLIQGEFLTAAVVSFVMVFGALIEEAASNSARKAIEALVSIAPQTATVLADGQARTVPIDEVRVGDLLLVKPGERIPVDAVMRQGITAVDESSMTGEPLPREKAVGDSVYAGTLNQNGVVEVEAVRVGEDTTLGKVIELVSEAQAHKPQAIRTIDRYARWFTPLILACAAVTWLITGEVDRAVTVLIVGCPCALILAAPTAVVAALGRAARAGILIKGGRVLEQAGRADVVLFDKTGTLTEGRPRVAGIVTVEGIAHETVLARAASVEQHSTHPLARAVLNAARYAQVTVSRAEQVFTHIGLGVRALVDGGLVEVGSAYLGGGSLLLPVPLCDDLEDFKNRGMTPLVVYENRRPVGVLGVTDHIRGTARSTVGCLKALGMARVAILSGDHERSTRAVAQAAGVDELWPDMTPEGKLGVIQRIEKLGHTVMFVGDGINDAPALATAHVGVAMAGAGTDVALETADVALMHDDIAKLPFLVILSRRMLTIIKWNIAFGLAFNAFAVLASGSGYLTPIMGAVVHNIGSVFVVACAASLAFMNEAPSD